MIDETASPAKQRVQQFHLRHGGECYQLEGFWYYPDGAYRDQDILGVLAEPPTLHTSGTPERLEYNLAAAKLKFYQAKLGAAVREFDALREEFSLFQPADENAAIKKLEELKTIVQARQKELRKAQAVVDATDIGRAIKGAAQRPHEEAVRRSSFRSKLNAVRI